MSSTDNSRGAFAKAMLSAPLVALQEAFTALTRPRTQQEKNFARQACLHVATLGIGSAIGNLFNKRGPTP